LRKLSLQQNWRVGLFGLVALLCAGLLTLETLRIAGAEAPATLRTSPQIARAATLWPDNPDLQYEIGNLRLYSSERPDAAEGMRELHRATELSPLRAGLWRGLAWACESDADAACADRAVERVRALAPMTPRAVWFVANYYLRSERNEMALAQFGHLLQLSPSYDQYVLRACDSAELSNALLEKLFTGAGPQVELTYISHLAARGDVASANQLWRDLAASAIQHNFSISMDWVEPYLDVLLNRGLGGPAREVWSDLQKLGVIHADPDSKENYVFNGDFEEPTSDSGLDWRLPDVAYATVDLVQDRPQHGQRCMRVDFGEGHNDTYLLAYELVPVDPNSHYLLTAQVRSEGITSDSGPYLQVFDPSCLACLNVQTTSTVGTTPWHQIQLRFSTGPQTHLARLQLARAASNNFPMEITGVFWLDNVMLKSEGSTRSEPISVN